MGLLEVRISQRILEPLLSTLQTIVLEHSLLVANELRRGTSLLHTDFPPLTERGFNFAESGLQTNEWRRSGGSIKLDSFLRCARNCNGEFGCEQIMHPFR